jgi:hypothetical protein
VYGKLLKGFSAVFHHGRSGRQVGIINTNRMKLHLTECQPYQQFLATQTAERAAKKRRIDTNEEDFVQATIGDHLTPARHARADELAALMIYQAGLPFTFFEKPEALAFLRALNSAYVPSKRASPAMLQPLESPVLALYKLHHLECVSWSCRILALYEEIRSLHLT